MLTIKNEHIELGCGLVQLGSKKFKAHKGVELKFKILFGVLKKYMSDGHDNPYFLRELMEMITDVPEEEWCTEKDPATKKTKDETLNNFIKRNFSKKFAKSIVYRLTTEYLIQRINERPESTRKFMAQDLKPYNSSINANNVAQYVADWMEDIIQEAAGLIISDELVQIRRSEIATDLKQKFGEYLANETERYCPFPGCGKMLQQELNGRTLPVYEVSLIDKMGSKDVDNLIACCPRCYAIYQLDNDDKMKKQLLEIKNILSSKRRSSILLDELSIEEGISIVIKRVKKLNETDLDSASFNPKDLTQKINPHKSFALYMSVRNYVSTYFVKINEIMISLDKRKIIDYEEIQNQIHAIYLRLKRANKSEEEIFNQITRKIQHVSLQDDLYCSIIVSFFIQKCEVF